MRLILFCLLSLFILPIWAETPSLVLAQEYQQQNIIGWAMSEKLDGVRGFWDGNALYSRQGKQFTPPKDWTKNFPPFALDGELFSKRGEFEQISAIVRSANSDWHNIQLFVFDVPNADGDLLQRLQIAQGWKQTHPESNFQIIPQYIVKNQQQAKDFFQEVTKNGGEGVIFRNPSLPYQAGRNTGFLKWKPQFDDECTVIKHLAGKGKHTGKMGAVLCENQHGQFRIGTGFTEDDRQNPPPVGSTITYRYRGFTSKGKPKFATYLRQYRE
ncbi:MAG: DNA ligase [Neisseriaceae bacterium]|nr:DNA ligase [Neisseriaceae bacterium]